MAQEEQTGRADLIRRMRESADNYGVVLALTISALLLPALMPYLPAPRTVTAVVMGLSVLTALHSSRAPRWLFRTAVVIATTWVVWTLPWTDRSPLAEYGSLTFLGIAALLIISPLAILNRIGWHRRVTFRTVAGAICVYLQLGLAFSALYFGLDLHDNLSISGANPISFVPYNYYSFITLTTVGYGDITPVGNLARTAAMFEALIGQVLLVTVVARTVTLLGREREPAEPGRRRLRQAVQRGELDIEVLPDDPADGADIHAPGPPDKEYNVGSVAGPEEDEP